MRDRVELGRALTLPIRQRRPRNNHVLTPLLHLPTPHSRPSQTPAHVRSSVRRRNPRRPWTRRRIWHEAIPVFAVFVPDEHRSVGVGGEKEVGPVFDGCRRGRGEGGRGWRDVGGWGWREPDNRGDGRIDDNTRLIEAGVAGGDGVCVRRCC